MSTKKNQILKAAAQLFAEQGFEKTSVAGICEAAHVSKGLIYHHFKSKEAILIETFRQSTDKMAELSTQSAPDLEPNAQLVHVIESLFAQLENETSFFQLSLNIMFQPSTKNLLQKQIKERAALLLKSVKSIFDQISPSNSTVQSYIFIAEIDGVALNYLSSFDDYPLAKVKEHLINKYMSPIFRKNGI
jgi:AcrR family transcriptional regulator